MDSSDLLRLRLLNHILSPTVTDFLLTSRHQTTSFALRVAVPHPYVLSLTLSLAADHYRLTIANNSPSEAAAYASHARNLRDDALVSFNSRTTKSTTDPDSTAAAFLFSSLLGLSLLCDLSHSGHYRSDLGTYFERFATYLQVSRGVQVLVSGHPDQQERSGRRDHTHEFSSYVDDAAMRFMECSRKSQHECDPIHELAARTDLDPKVRGMYEASIESLQRCFDVGRATDGDEPANWSDILAWPVTAPIGFAEKVAVQDAVALVAVAYFGVLLHRHRSCWALRDLGLFTVTSVRGILGHGFDNSLALPIQEVL